jgi:hypothetical protein
MFRVVCVRCGPYPGGDGVLRFSIDWRTCSPLPTSSRHRATPRRRRPLRGRLVVSLAALGSGRGAQGRAGARPRHPAKGAPGLCANDRARVRRRSRSRGRVFPRVVGTSLRVGAKPLAGSVAAAGAVLASAAPLATRLPAHRATRVDPVIALRPISVSEARALDCSRSGSP